MLLKGKTILNRRNVIMRTSYYVEMIEHNIINRNELFKTVNYYYLQSADKGYEELVKSCYYK